MVLASIYQFSSSKCTIATFLLSNEYEHVSRVGEATTASARLSSRTTWRTCTPALTRARTLVSNVPQVNAAITTASDEQLRVGGHWGDAPGWTAAVTRTNGVHHLAGSVHEEYFNFNVPQFVDCLKFLNNQRLVEKLTAAPIKTCAHSGLCVLDV